MRFNLYFFIFLLLMISCGNEKRENNNEVIDSSEMKNVNTELNNNSSTIIGDTNTQPHINSGNDIKLPPIDTTGHAAQVEKMKKANVEIKVFKNTEISGYGYDIILEGHTYVHQPNIPALPGNNGFATEKLARKVAELVSFKIRNNIMPPTVEVKELDSLGVK